MSSIHRGKDSERGGVAVRNRDDRADHAPAALIEEERETFIEILRMPERMVVSVLELLSPSKDRLWPEGLSREEAGAPAAGGPSRGTRPAPGGRTRPVDRHGAGRLLSLRQPGRSSPRLPYLRLGVLAPLPRVPIPLRHPDPDVIVDLAAVFSETYDRGRIAKTSATGKRPGRLAGRGRGVDSRDRPQGEDCRPRRREPRQ